ncbi:Mis12-domain-containing protein [Conidiobolus coronatus NRRL 28638]|uniref:Mis12-domain-containing protein n=1 Tax=Conidiobolus coronatus (strain ATCC 28846 / CBS 209.66 / NRRL 28638) TaxID=796925 RepID=A0A137NPC0_CONC2|nr:Mis12-domain-containing protein [Conidiobolus coronatus NRRL 28638]|eukprot:KXN64583.1 Mis12-domain-containing protein [Conidiobolus coronatus NRRL 28638]
MSTSTTNTNNNGSTSPSNKRTYSSLTTSTNNNAEDKAQQLEKRNKLADSKSSNGGGALTLEEKTRLNELVIEKLDFIPLHFVDDIINSVNNLLYQALDSFKDFLKTRLSGELQINQGMHEIETLLESSIDKNFDLFELYCLNNIFNMSKNENYDNRFYQYLDDEPCTVDQIDNIEKELEKVSKELSLEKAKALELDVALNNKLKLYTPRQKAYEELKKLTKLLKQYNIVHLKDHFTLIKENIDRILLNDKSTAEELEELKEHSPEQLMTERELYFEDRILTRLKFLPKPTNLNRKSQELMDGISSQVSNILINEDGKRRGEEGEVIDQNLSQIEEQETKVLEIEGSQTQVDDGAIEDCLKRVEVVGWGALNDL